MADRYWVGGTANWDGTAGTKWATTSGGAGGASVPTSSDDVFFDANSGAGTVTIAIGNNGAKSINCTGFTGTITGTTNIIVAGSVTLVSGMTYTHTGRVTFSADATLTTAGKTFSSVTVDGGTITVQLGDALTSQGDVTVTRGTFTTNNFSVTATQLASSNTNTRTINLGSSTVTLSGSTTPIGFGTATNLTFNAGTSTINSNHTLTQNFNLGADLTFYNISTSVGSLNFNGTATSVTINNLTVVAPSTAGVRSVLFGHNCVINGTLSTTGTAGNQRVWFYSGTYGVRRTLTVNSAPSLTDADFRDVIVNGTAAPISGTRIGNRGACSGITFSAPKTVYFNNGINWSGGSWAATSGGSVSTDNFPLPQDTAVFNNTSSVATVTLDGSIPFTGTVDMSARTNAMTLAFGNATTCYGSFTAGSGITFSGTNTLTFSGEGTKTITSAGKTFSCAITIDAYGGTVELADAFATLDVLLITRGTFDTKSYSLNVLRFRANNNDISYIKLGSSTITATATNNQSVTFDSSLSTLDAGTSTFICTNTNGQFLGGGYTFYNVSFTDPSPSGTRVVHGANTFNNLSFTFTSEGAARVSFNANTTINGTLTCSGSTATARGFLSSSVIGTPITLTVNAISANNCDFRDITLAGAAAGASPTRAGDCGGNSGINFPAPKNAYRVSTADNTWGGGASGWALTSGGTGSRNNFPLAQDTAVIDNSSIASGGNLNSGRWNVGSIDFSSRTIPVNIDIGTATFPLSGNLTLSSSVTVSGSQTIQFVGRGTQTITSAGATLAPPIEINCATGTVQLADALTIGSTRTLTLASGTFDAVTYNVTIGAFNCSSATNTTLKMGSGLWTLSGTGTVWLNSTFPAVFYKGTADILLSDTSTTARTFAGGGLSYNKLTIGGATGTSTTTITGNNQFTELASTKTVAHTISFSTAQTFGAWTVTGSAGNVVTIIGSASNVLVGSATSGIDYLAMGSTGFADTSTAEFYAGANSTGTAGAPVYRTAKPADSTRYWVGGTGNWSDTARWSTSSGGAGGASVPRSHDDVVFDSLSNLTAYTATINAVTGGIRCKSLTIAPPATGNITLAGSTAIVGIHGDVTLPATGLTRTYTGAITLSGSTTGRTFTTNGVTLASAITVNGVGCGWTLGSSLSTGANVVTITNGSFDTGNYNLAVHGLSSSNTNSRTITLGSSSITLTFNNGFNLLPSTNLTLNAGTSNISMSGSAAAFIGGGLAYYNLSFTDTSAGTRSIQGANTFNNLTLAGNVTGGLTQLSINANQTITGTFTCSGLASTARGFVRSDTIGTTRTLTVGTLAANDCDFRDITIAGTAAGTAPTRAGDCGGNSGITFPAPKTVYWNRAGNSTWDSVAWATASGGTANANNFPLAQDTAVIDDNNGATQIIFNSTFNISSLDASARTNALNLNSTATCTFYGSFILGSGVTTSNAVTQTFSGRGTMTFTSAGKTITFPLTVDSPTGTFQLGDAFSSSNTITHTRGTLDAVTYNVTATTFFGSGTTPKVLNMGSGLWTLSGTGTVWDFASGASVNLNKGTANILLSNNTTTARTFAGSALSYNKLTIGGDTSTSTTTIGGANTFTEIASTKTVVHTIALSATTQRVGAFTVTGTAGNVVTITGNTSNLIYTGSGAITGLDYLNVQGRVYGSAGQITDVWYAGANSVNSGSLGWVFAAGVAPPPSANANFFLMFG